MAKTLDTTWTKYANDNLKGRKIKECRYLTHDEMENLGWYNRSVVLELDDGTLIYPSQDDEGNGAGALFGNNASGEALTFPVLSNR